MDLMARGMARSACGKTISDTTYSAEWISGTPSADPATDTITLPVGHGLANGDPVEFDAGSGVLPGNLFAYNMDTKGGYYCNVINLSGNTCQLCDTVGGTTPIDITSAGMNGWRIRKAGFIKIDIPLDFSVHKEIKIFLKDMGQAKITTASTGLVISFNNSDQNCKIFFAASYGYFYGTFCSGSIKKYSRMPCLLILKYISDNELSMISTAGGTSSDNKESPQTSILSNTYQYDVVNTSKITLMSIFIPQPMFGMIRNGARVIVTN